MHLERAALAAASSEPPQHNRVAPLAFNATLPEVLQRLGQAEERCQGHGREGCEPACEQGCAFAAPLVPIWRAHEEAALFLEGEPGHTLFVVRSGSFKCVRTQEDGYEQVVSFVQAGGLLGMAALHGSVHSSGAVALEDSTVYAIAARDLAVWQHECPLLFEALWRGLSGRLAQAAETAEMMAAVSSEARLARFLLWLSRRMQEAGQSPLRLHLRMSRRDIASLLGVAHETVSRSFSLLAERGCLRVDNREVEIVDMHALRQRARATRGVGLADESGDMAVCAAAGRPAPARVSVTGIDLRRGTPATVGGPGPARPRTSWWGESGLIESSHDDPLKTRLA